jgi:purine-nucleoside phosphorylase
MNLSNLKENSTFYKEKSILDIVDIVAWKKSNKSYNFETLPKTAILSLSRFLLSRKQRIFSKKLKGLFGQNYVLDENYVYCSEFGNGAPAIIGLMEELRVFGVENFIFIGLAGVLKETVDKKAFIVNTTFSTTGTTYLYSDKDCFQPKKEKWFEFFAKELSYKETICWSTDAPFRETESLVSFYQKKEATHVDMECAAIYAFAEFYKLNALCVVVSADSLLNLTWNPPKDKGEINLALKKTIKKIIDLNYET